MSLGDGKLYMMNTVQIVNQSLYKIEHIAKQACLQNRLRTQEPLTRWLPPHFPEGDGEALRPRKVTA